MSEPEAEPEAKPSISKITGYKSGQCAAKDCKGTAERTRSFTGPDAWTHFMAWEADPTIYHKRCEP